MKNRFYLSLLSSVFCMLTSLPMQGQDTIHYGDSNSRYLFMPLVIDTTVVEPHHVRYECNGHVCSALIYRSSFQQLISQSYYMGYVVDEPTTIYGIASTHTQGQSPLYLQTNNEQFGFDLYAMLVQKEGDLLYHVDSVMWSNQRLRLSRYFIYPQYSSDFPIHDTLVEVTELYFTTPRVVVDTFYVGFWFSNMDCDTIDNGYCTFCWVWGALNGSLINNLAYVEHNRMENYTDDSQRYWGGIFPIIVPPDTDSFECPRVQNLRVAEYRDGRPMFNWDRAGGQQPFQIAFGPADEDPDSYRVVTAASPPYLLPDLELDSTVVYAARCRGRCHHTCVIHDTILWSEWSDTIHFTIGRDTPEGIVPVERGEVAFALSPNPAKERVTVAVGEGVGMPCTVVLRDEQGRELLRQRMEGRELTLSTRGLATGVCLVTVESPRGSSTQKLVVEN